MAARGHTDDCAACAYDELPPVDQLWFQEHDYVPEHVRRPEPVDPGFPVAKWNRCLAAILIGSLAGCFLTAYSLLIFLAFVVVIAVDRPLHGLAHTGATHRWCRWCLERVPRDYIHDRDAWRKEQGTVWRERTALNQTWRCPTCGQINCRTEHVGDPRTFTEKIPMRKARTQK